MKSSDVGVWCLLLWSTIIFLVRYVTCTGLSDAKLINQIFNTGEVRVEYNGEWCAVCTGMDYTREAHVICQHLGYLGGWTQSHQNNATQNVEIACAEVNTPLESCDVSSKESVPDCTKTLGVQCYNYSAVYLVDNPPERPNIGRLQIQYDDIMTDVCFMGQGDDLPWDDSKLNNINLKVSIVLCLQSYTDGVLQC
ncbi:galectin-3-binding protein-like [Amphiura filiformis]|uniref:galectin-3-binding protein-like n=1 Tax=Amphiura filiformis TaxID=82378 RepID=UPI003B228F3A